MFVAERDAAEGKKHATDVSEREREHPAASVLARAPGTVTAFDGNAAAPKLAERIVEEIRTARGEAKPKK